MVKKIIKSFLSDDVIVKLKTIMLAYFNDKMLKKAITIRRFDSTKLPFGINLIGDIRAETGLGQSMRIIARMLKESDIPFVILQIDSPGGLEHDNRMWDDKICEEVVYGINLIHINPNIWAEKYCELDRRVLDFRYNIAFWLWELEVFPLEWASNIDTIDEIWVPSDFISLSIKARTDKPVITVPYIIKLDKIGYLKRSYFGLPSDVFLYLVMYDFKSVSERKNPMGAINAYKKAFKKNENRVGLVIKVNHLKNEKELYKIKQELKGYNNIYFITKNLSRNEIESLISIVNVFVSLHRSEGFGLPLAEAMCMGTPVIATNWSATTEFMNQTCACLVNYDLVQIEKDIGPYKKGNRWAEPNIDHAAFFMRKLYEDADFYHNMQKNGKLKLKNDSKKDIILDRMRFIYK